MSQGLNILCELLTIWQFDAVWHTDSHDFFAQLAGLVIDMRRQSLSLLHLHGQQLFCFQDEGGLQTSFVPQVDMAFHGSGP